MTVYNILAFTVAMFLLAITPGVGVFATVSRALVSGFYNASFIVLGIVLGDIIFLLFAIFGLSSIASLLGDFFIIVKYLGATYLFYLGYKILTSKELDSNIKEIKELSWRKNFISGLFITLSNPKVILFYLSFLPTFVNLQTLTIFDTIIISFIVTTILGGVMLTYAYSVSKAKKLFKNKNARKKIDILAGSTMITAGVVLVAKT